MALNGRLVGLSEWETRQRYVCTTASLDKTACTNGNVSQSTYLVSRSGLLNELDSTWEHTTAPPSLPFHRHGPNMYEEQSWQPISCDQRVHCETVQQYRTSAHPAELKQSSSINEFSDGEARTVGHGRPRSVSQPLPPKGFSPPPYKGNISSSHTNGFQEFGDSLIPEGRSSHTYFRTHLRSQGSTSPDNLKTTRTDRLLAFHSPSCDTHQYSNTATKNGTRNHPTMKQSTKMQKIAAVDQFPSGDPLSKLKFCFQNGHSYAANELEQGLGSNSDFLATSTSDFSYAPVQSNVCPGNPLSQSSDELSNDVFTALQIGQLVTPEEQLRTNASQPHSLSFHQRKIQEKTHMGTPCQPPLWPPPGPGVIGGEKKRRDSRWVAILNDFDIKESTARERPEQTKNICSKRGSEHYQYFCPNCKVSLTTEEQAIEHRNSNKHRNKLSKYRHPTFCDYCKVNLNSESQAKEHFSSGRHEQTVAKSQKAPVKIHPLLGTVKQSFVPICNTLTSPVGYQIELYKKGMITNGVCFLPTGTGKNLVAALVIAHTLYLNPTRQIIFLVDRVLLVLQQSDYLRKELGHLKVQIPQVCVASLNSAKQHSVSERPIRIGAVCGEMRKLDGQARIFEHDILVITADCYRNHLSNRTLRVEDVSLIVLDEAHHCNKDHPYNVIMREHYLQENSFLMHKPKVLGLTTSAAGEPSLDRTAKKLQRLLSNLGNATLLTVTHLVRELEERTNQPELVCLRTEHTPAERDFLDGLVEYATKCFNQAVRMSELKNYKEIFQPSAGNVLNKEDIFPILGVIDNILLQSVPDGDAHSSLLHFQIICEAICSLQECGARVALEGFRCLYDERSSYGFDWAVKKGLSFDKVNFFVRQFLPKGALYLEEFETMDSGVQRLLEQLQEVDWHRARVSSRPLALALVLVKRPSTACYLANYLSGRQELVQRYMSVACVVSSGEAILNIREKEGHVVVATNVTWEGLDLADCELVIQMDPPCSVTALSQIRSRAWKRGTRLVAVCRDDEHSRRIQDLLRREEYMNMATHDILLA